MGSKKFWLRRAHKVPVKTNYRVLKILENIQRSRGFQTEERFMRALENGKDRRKYRKNKRISLRRRLPSGVGKQDQPKQKYGYL